MSETAPDYGADGLAALSRTSRMVSVEGRARGSAAPGERVMVRRVLSTVYDRMHHAGQLSDRQFVAARRLGALFWASRLGAQCSARYDRSTGRALTDGDETAEDAYHATMRQLCTAYQLRLQSLLDDNHPGLRFLPSLQSALERLADMWGIERAPNPDEPVEMEEV